MKRLCAFVLLCLAAFLLAEAAPPAKWTEHRRALLVNTSDNNAHTGKVRELEQALRAKGFVVKVIGDAPKTDGFTYEKWVRSIPTMGVSVFYYLGRLETEKTPDGKRVCYSMPIGGYKEIPPARDPDLGRAQAEDKPWLSLDRLSQKLSKNTARANLVVIDCLGIDDKAKSGLKEEDGFSQAQGLFRGELFSSFYPGKAAFHPSLKAPAFGPLMADALIESLKVGKAITPRIEKLGYTVTPRDKTFELKHNPTKVCAPPHILREGRFAGDQWVDQNGFCFVWCPAGTFTMGDKAFEDAQPVEVTLSKGFWIGKYETLGDEAHLFNAGGQKLGNRYAKFLPPSIGSVDKVVPEMKKWHAYSADKGLAYDGWTYDYPTEAEWEYACRAGSRAGYPSDIKDLGKYGNFADRMLYDDRELVHYVYACREADDGYGRVFAPVGQFLPNAWGIHDMLGNLAELCSTYYLDKLTAGTDPNFQSLPDPRGSRHRISRGGSWCSPPEYLHVAFRNAFTGAQSPHAGMRLVLRQGEGRTRTRTEISKGLQDKLDAEKKARQKENEK
ncbi:MAG: formylglycine-generating enzyme family protein [Opitutae bacterium]|nr:formylglycine-generating enzyme family protein [Opitutae bacterium]MBT5692786.1 formylglycine-generating enzyme family protein [Opitutae bacterium]MBT6462611.1 formylglycine-generating enzyme family protein [Opitutae bacterium]MBT7854627.1 formylglycine-generating enzyme family protein [Opitutae bacterium]